MKVIPFPGGGAERPDEVWLTELEAALDGTAEDPRADSWRELREDVRTLAPPISPEFERELGERIAEWSARSRSTRAAPKPSTPKQPRRRWGWPHRPSRPALASVSVACAVIAAVLIAAPWRPAGHAVESSPSSLSLAARSDNAGRASGTVASAPAVTTRTDKAAASGAGASAEASGSASVGAARNAPAASGAAAAPVRVQQLGASIALTAIPAEVQAVADRVSRLAVSEGGFVRSSHVNEAEKAGEADLTLSVPSVKLSAALAALGQLAPVRAESQSLQDITNEYDQARQRLNDATAERRALLRALARASTEGEIDSLRARLAQTGGAIARDVTALGTLAKQASNAEVEVTVLGDSHAGSEGPTFHRGLHDAGRVLTVTLIVLLIAAAVLVPLALLAIVLATVRRAWLRYRRERALGGG
jgi:hypothetical protein